MGFLIVSADTSVSKLSNYYLAPFVFSETHQAEVKQTAVIWQRNLHLNKIGNHNSTLQPALGCIHYGLCDHDCSFGYKKLLI